MGSIAGLALSRTRLTLEAGVTGALNLAWRAQLHRKRAPMAADVTPLSDVRFLTVAEVAAIMRVSKMTVYRLVHSGDLEAIRVGRSFRVPEEAVNQYLRHAFVGTG
jgi:excisionase family DNA binding protein